MKRLAFLALFFGCSIGLFAQEITVSIPDTLYHRVMIIPFDQKMYLSDADTDIGKESGYDLEEIRRRFRLGLDISLHASMVDDFGSYPILRDTAKEAREDLAMIYQGISYYYDIPDSVVRAMKAELEQPAYKRMFRKGKKGNEETEEMEMGLFEGDQRKDFIRKHPNKYLNVRIRNEDLLDTLNTHYSPDLYLFINQMEIETDYDDCIDRVNQIYNRKMRVHYSMFTPEGIQVAGDVVEVDFPSNSNNVSRIIGTDMPQLARALKKRIPPTTYEGIFTLEDLEAWKADQNR
jgi:hypothetical protein